MTDFRPMREEETEAVVALWRACDLTRPWNDPHHDIRRAIEGPASDILIAEDGEEIAATVMIGHEGHRAWVYYLAVSPGHRRKGLGALAMAAAEEWARARDMPKMHLMVRRENTSVGAFYDSLGYHEDDITTLVKWLDKDAERLKAEHANPEGSP